MKHPFSFLNCTIRVMATPRNFFRLFHQSIMRRKLHPLLQHIGKRNIPMIRKPSFRKLTSAQFQFQPGLCLPPVHPSAARLPLHLPLIAPHFLAPPGKYTISPSHSSLFYSVNLTHPYHTNKQNSKGAKIWQFIHSILSLTSTQRRNRIRFIDLA